MKTIVAVLALMLAVLLGLAGLVALSQHRENQRLRGEQARLAAALEEMTSRLGALNSSNAAALRELETANLRVAELRAAASNALAAASAEPTKRPASTNTILPRAYQARAFLGTQFVGDAWVIPSNIKRDVKTGLLHYDQVIQLPLDVRNQLTTHVTNTIAVPAPPEPQQVSLNNYIDQRYVDSRPWVYWGPLVPPVQPLPPVQPGQPYPPTWPNTPIYRPGTPYQPPSGRGLYVPPGLR